VTRRTSFVAELRLVIDGTGATETRLFGTEGWTTTPTDTPANTHIAGSLADPGSIKSELFTGARLTGPVRPSFGQIVLNNAAGALDDLMNYGMGGTVTVRYGTVGDAYPSAWTTVFVAYAYALVVDFKEVRVLLRDRMFLLEKPVVTVAYTTSSGGYGGTGIVTKKQQLVLGRPGFIPLVLYDQSKQIYFMQINGASDRQWIASSSADYNVFDGGVPLTRGVPYASAEEGLATAPAPGEFRIWAEGAATDAAYESTGPVYVRLGSPPAFDLRAQAVGMLKTNAETRARPWTFLDLLSRAGLSVTVAAGSTTLTAGNRLIDGDQTYLEVMADGAAARFEAFGFNRLDEFFMANLALGVEGSDASVYTFTEHNARDFRRQPVPGQESPAWQVSVTSGVAWPSQIANSLTAEDADKFKRERQQSFTGTADSVRLANPGAESAVMDVQGNEFAALDQRKAFVKRYFELFGGRRDLISVTAQLTAATIAIGLHDKVTVDIPRLGCAGGRYFRVVVVELNLRARTATFLLWGGDVGPSDAVLGGGSGVANPDDVNPLLVEMGDFTFDFAGSVGSGSESLTVHMGDFTFIFNVDAIATIHGFDSSLHPTNYTYANNDTELTRLSASAGTHKTNLSITTHSAGKRYLAALMYVELTDNGFLVGAVPTGSATNGYPGEFTGGRGCQFNRPAGVGVWAAGSFSSLASSTIANQTDTVMMAIDFDAGKIWYGLNGTWYNSGDPAAGTNPSQTFTAGTTMHAAMSEAYTSNVEWFYFNGGSAYGPPAGFTYWDV
jgi:hypothetical protein